MQDLLEELIAQLRKTDRIETTELAALIRKHNRNIHEVSRHLSKKKALRAYLNEKRTNSELWQSWDIDAPLDARIVNTLQMKPRRTASGVATITIITKPAKCTSNCLYCPNDVRMPKSYLADEPACQRAERNFFDPYLQVASRLKALEEMGHETDKIELIVLGGTWSDYPQAYQIWFVRELFAALNEERETRMKKAEQRRAAYRHAGVLNGSEELATQVKPLQDRVNAGEMGYNEALETLYGTGSAWEALAVDQQAAFPELEAEHVRNETAQHRVVGLVVETRPDAITPENLKTIRRLGCTKVQIGVQSLREDVLRANRRSLSIARIQEAFSLLRIFGFKTHAHFMLNLLGATPESELADYRLFVESPLYSPDEVKLYPCVLVEGTGLCRAFDDGRWTPYPEDELVGLLRDCVLATPQHTRISRMIRDISAHDIKAGSKKTNLRQMVESAVASTGEPVREIRLREISTEETSLEDLRLEVEEYPTAASNERFLQWVTPENKIVGFLRLSLPHQSYVRKHAGELPIAAGEAMIREVHVYGRVARLHETGFGSQHLGLGKRLVEAACDLAREAGYQRINVISAIGTREYYRKLGFADAGLYQQRDLLPPMPQLPDGPTVANVRKSMQGNKRRDTSPELKVRAMLRELGYPGYRLDWKKAPGHPDIAFPGRKVAIFVHGCFWHRCPVCQPSAPKSNTDYWEAKFERNRARDVRTHAQLEEMGWKSIVIWEHQLKKKNLDETKEWLAKALEKTGRF